MRIALLEDDPDQAAQLQALLERAGHAVHLFLRGRPLLNNLAHESYDVIVLDWVVPDVSGYDVLRTIRSQTVPHTPVLFLTNRDSETDIVQALEAGADDFVVKPLRERELLSRIKALGRRSHEHSVASEVLEIGLVRIDVAHREITRNGQPIELTPREFDVAVFFFRQPGKLVSRAHLMEVVWGRSSDASLRTVDTHISRLRQALGLSTESGVRMTPIYGYGYRLDVLRSEASSA
ncbi:MAG: response regulator transcription factor [Gammaproteobacteria bacterium]|nr:response regulator transcription factor [Gammaproteobacteria bacterium]